MSDTDFIAALKAKILSLEGDKDELEEDLANVEVRLEVLQELLTEEGDHQLEDVIVKSKKKRRKKDSKNKKISKRKVIPIESDPIQEEASRMKGTDPEIAERLSKKKFVPVARQVESYGPGIHPGVSGPSVSEHTPGVGDNE